jgi:valyl-tRNA synthetase
LTPAKDSDVESVGGRAQAAHPPQECSECGGKKLEQDPDVLDTWFSSALWPFSTLGWPDDTGDLKAFYPTTLMVNGFDILFFWDARMVMMGLKLLQDIRPEEKDRIPFRQLYIHALVRDAERQKMSKTRGNVIDPLHITEQYGTDAVRFTLAIMAAPGTDITLSEDRIKSYRAFANKIWNASRFVFMNLDKAEETSGQSAEAILGGTFPLPRDPWPQEPDLADRWIASRLKEVASTVHSALEEFRYHEASHELYHFFWHDFCDWYIEWTKLRLFDENNQPNTNVFRNLLCVMEEALRLLHPFMPFITEELWSQLPHTGSSIALAPYPQPGKISKEEKAAETEMDLLQEAITALRNLRAEMKIDARKKIPGELSSAEPSVKKLFDKHHNVILRLANLSELTVSGDSLPDEGGRLNHAARFDARLPFSETDLEDERKRLQKEKSGLEKQLAGTNAKLGNDQFLSKAPGHVIENIRQKKSELRLQGNVRRAQFARNGNLRRASSYLAGNRHTARTRPG